MKEEVRQKFDQINQMLETKPLPFSVPLEGLSLKDAEEIRYELNHNHLRIEIYEEFKIIHLGIYSKD